MDRLNNPGEEATHLPAVPVLADLQSHAPDGVAPHLVTLLAPTAFEAESFRVLSYMIDHVHREVGVRVIAISSPSMGDGKTSTAINLVGILAQDPTIRVLLVEAELRRPTIASYLGLRPRRRQGLVEALLDPTLPLERVIQPRRAFNFDLLSAGRSYSSPYDLLRLPRFGELLDEARKYYDYIIVDTPPLIPFADCRLIEKWTDGFLVVVAAHKTPRKLVEEAIDSLDPNKLIGLVFNQDSYQSPKYYKAYRYYS